MALTEARPTLDDLRARREEIIRIAGAHGASNIRIFGSVARSEADASSDVDFLVDMELGRTVLDLSELILDLEDSLGCQVDVVELRTASAFADEIQREAVPL